MTVNGTARAVVRCAGFRQEFLLAYPTATLDKIDSTAIDSKFGPLAAPASGLHFAYVNKTGSAD